ASTGAMKPKVDTRKVKRPATTHPTGETKSAPRSRPAIAATFVSPLGAKKACSASAAPGWAGARNSSLALRRPVAGGGDEAARVGAGRGATATAALRWLLRLRALRREDLLTLPRSAWSSPRERRLRARAPLAGPAGW